MNERTKELAEQAGVDAGQLFAEMLCNDSEVNVKIAEAWNAQPDEVRQRIFQVIEQNQSKFAELIVKETINEMIGQLWNYGIDESNNPSFYKAVERTKQHFGVE